ncbi:MAG: bifunctional riboflavin kinase/FAD synthetase [Rhodospirillaceae bacterium]|jgi:riboflavin kinase / FMN adenylyltransferase|nr:bifunctional riboflavin kinase/FAD synthetase [Rhodospirillaceae bacterium]MBT4219081.1 bifunctional riboflavin kinase/FAD synthetase [Rhodospirillaceae bacterium]MBT4463940.1 bifunctional riboflavin kinase/FAD synthetase [Rhodospirillaceae bacterium]MBT5308196.1 bifunctional riboflavin kinase/FAD synthetase [Rhodospirillaceae bacterium]MBT6407117.1 bifunctional riboflavin kinase/FAD synthetase [Rhodospirillaceae bacterium]
MQIFRHTENLPVGARGSAVAIGNFDGIHRGHQGVIGEAGRIAHDQGIPWSVLTFEPHPRSLFKPTDEAFRLTPFRTKARHIEELGVDNLIVLHFDKDFSAQTAEDFITRVLINDLAARHVVSGYDFVFGNNRAGNCDLLLHRGKEEGFDFTCVSAIDDGDKVYSSTRVRKFLHAGDARGAAAVLGRAYEIEGRVEHGDQRGRTIGTPTANVHLDEYLCPAFGVYAIRAGLDEEDGSHWYDGVANLGLRPTFDGKGVVLEAHLFDFDGDLYGRHLRVAFIEHLRDEKKFDGIDALKAQIADDCDAARRILAAGKG